MRAVSAVMMMLVCLGCGVDGVERQQEALSLTTPTRPPTDLMRRWIAERDEGTLDLKAATSNAELKCHATSSGWLKCEWPYSPAMCNAIGDWVWHVDGSCCLRL